ncbi:hypothetical protein GCM10010407_02010 [Rarobacter incanus]
MLPALVKARLKKRFTRFPHAVRTKQLYPTKQVGFSGNGGGLNDAVQPPAHSILTHRKLAGARARKIR